LDCGGKRAFPSPSGEGGRCAASDGWEGPGDRPPDLCVSCRVPPTLSSLRADIPPLKGREIASA